MRLKGVARGEEEAGYSSDRVGFLPSYISKLNEPVCDYKDDILTTREHRTSDARLSTSPSTGVEDDGSGQRQTWVPPLARHASSQTRGTHRTSPHLHDFSTSSALKMPGYKSENIHQTRPSRAM